MISAVARFEDRNSLNRSHFPEVALWAIRFADAYASQDSVIEYLCDANLRRRRVNVQIHMPQCDWAPWIRCLLRNA